MISRITGTLLAVALTTSTARAQPLGTAFSYQGQLKNGGGPAAGLHDLRFQLHDAISLGLPVGPVVCFDNVDVIDGLFTVSLDFGAEFAGLERFLEIEVRADAGLDCTDLADFIFLAPRQALTAVPNSLYAVQAGGFVLPFVGTANLLAGTAVDVTNTATSDFAIGGSFQCDSTSGRGVLGLAPASSGVTAGVEGRSSSDAGFGVLGKATSATGTTHGVWGEAHSSTGRGVFGWAPAATGYNYGVFGQSESHDGYGVYGLVTATSGHNYGGWFESSSPIGTGVHGRGLTYGGSFRTDGTSGYGVHCWATASTGNTYGVMGRSDSTSGIGVFGTAESLNGTTYGGYFDNNSTDGCGVFGRNIHVQGITFGGRFESKSDTGIGVFGWTNDTNGVTYAVYGQCDSLASTAYAVWAVGRSGASGTKSFRIDHPDDPENKYLLHYSTESPEVLNVYRGTVTLNGAGEAIVELPHYFAKINKSPSYQLTGIGAPMPNLHVAGEIDEAMLIAAAKAKPGDAAPVCWFRIAGGASGKRVSWEVKALRNDRWVQKHGAPVEIEKQDLERGTYQHPELYGQPPEKGVNYRAEQGRPSQTAEADSTPK